VTLHLQKFRRGMVVVEAAQLTEGNLWELYEWADSKPFFGPAKDAFSSPTITGLTVWEPTGRHKAEFGDWVYRTPAGDFRTRTDDDFRHLFTQIEVTP
jgi:hypothetical protein